MAAADIDGTDTFLLTPLREGRREYPLRWTRKHHFYSRPCGRGDAAPRKDMSEEYLFLLTPLREGRQSRIEEPCDRPCNFYSRPCGRGDRSAAVRAGIKKYFYSRPCGRGDARREKKSLPSGRFLLTPLREGRHFGCVCWLIHS